jgi:uncharacterized protein YbjT (DUF2867 family)
MKYFVTGATGFVGGHVARQLIAAGHEVVAVVRNPAQAGELADLGVVLHKGDVTEKGSMRVPMQGVDGVFHIAGWYKIGVKDKTPAVVYLRTFWGSCLEFVDQLRYNHCERR